MSVASRFGPMKPKTKSFGDYVTSVLLGLYFRSCRRAMQIHCCTAQSGIALLQETFDLLAKKIIDVPAKKTFALKDVGDAIKESLQSGVGKVYLSN